MAQPGREGVAGGVVDEAGVMVGQAEQGVEVKILAGDTPIMPVDQVRIGMKGYGLTVFHGTRIEAFPVEVISIVGNSTPRQSTVWIRCPDERMQQSGPVQGMSGSPIFLWEEGVEGEPGEGGRLIGAFAFGFAFAKDCLVGVQPIEYMRESAARVEAEGADVSRRPGSSLPGSGEAAERRGAGAAATLGSMERLALAARSAGASPGQTVHLYRLRDLLAGAMGERQPQSTAARQIVPSNEAAVRPGHPVTAEGFLAGAAGRVGLNGVGGTSPSRQGVLLSAASASASPGGVEGPARLEAVVPDPAAPPAVSPLMLPISVRSPETAAAMRPLLRDVGLFAATAGPGLGNTPPPGFDVTSLRIEPGSVLAIPLAYGDGDYSALGTVTDVLPDGRVMGFGHAMFAEGDTAMPLATGYIHFVVPSVQTSFKQGGSYQIVGSILQDENVGVSGDARTAFQTAPVTLHVNLPRQPRRTFRYTLVDHPLLSPQIAATLVLDSLSSAQALPRENTLRMSGTYRFSGGRTLTTDSTLPGGDAMALLWEVYPLLGAIVANPFEPLAIEGIDLTFDVEDGIQAGVITNATLDQAEVRPGDAVGVTLQVQPYAKEPITRRVTFKVPAYLDEGDYEFIIGDASVYSNFLFSSRPDLNVTQSVDDLFASVQEMLSVQEDALYVIMPLPRKGLALGRDTLPRLPSSVAAMIATPTTTAATPYAEAYTKKIDTDLVIQGGVGFTLAVRK